MSLNRLSELLWLSEKTTRAFRKAEISSDNSVKLVERVKNTRYIFNITGLSNGALVIKCPSDQHRFFHPNKDDYTKICDYLIFILNGKKVTVIFCELKETFREYEISDGGQQIKSTIPLLKYMLAGIETHFGDKWEVEMHYAIIANKENINRMDRMGKDSTSSKKNNPKEPYSYKGIKINVITGASTIPIRDLLLK